MPVADPEDGNVQRENGGIDARRIRFGDAARSAGDDDAADPGELIAGGLDRQHVALHASLAHAPREQMAVLPTCIEDGDTEHGGIIVDSRESSVDSQSRQSTVSSRQSAVDSRQSQSSRSRQSQSPGPDPHSHGRLPLAAVGRSRSDT